MAGAYASDANLEETLALGVRFVGTSWETWISSAARQFTERAQAGRRSSRV